MLRSVYTKGGKIVSGPARLFPAVSLPPRVREPVARHSRFGVGEREEPFRPAQNRLIGYLIERLNREATNDGQIARQPMG